MLHRGGCHCGKVQFEFDSDARVTVQRCNCSVCELTGFLHLIIPASAFDLKTSWDELTMYEFNTKTAKHYFCSTCGIKSFYIPRSNPDGYSINFRCVDESTFEKVTIEDFDGRNWEDNAASLAHLSRDE